ncbi:MAG TPA: outer membrane protein [Methylocella sp.]|nr:outer membrane protein [Methylocella sp.]
MYRKLLMASVSAIAFTGSAALAADLPSRAPPPVYVPPAPIFTWTGIYVGGQIGYAWSSGSNQFTGYDPFSGVGLATSVGGSPNGVIGGANVGYNYQINQWVVGLEGTVDGTSLSNTGVASLPILGGTFGVNANSQANIEGSIRGRVGIAWDRALIYATGGVAFGGFNSNYSIYGTDALGEAFSGSASTSTTRVGWTVGGGIQYAITNNWSVRAEYRYTDWGSIYSPQLFPALATFSAFAPFHGAFLNGSHSIEQNQVQVGFDYKFDLFTPPPVVAKY